MIFHINPVTYIFSIAVDGERLVLKSVYDTKRDEFFREMVGSVVI
jgi:hypothetical protein